MIPDQLRERIEAFLAAGHLAVLSAAGPRGVISLPVEYRADGLALDCAVPGWSDLAYLIEADPDVTLVLATVTPDGLSWLQYHGQATPVQIEPWVEFQTLLPKGIRPEDLFRFLRLRPTRIELVRGRHGHGTRETLDF